MLKGLFVGLSGFVIFVSGAFAQQEDGNRALLITKLESVYQHLAPKDPSKVAVTLRLADLYAERARVEAMNELNQGCSPCKAGEADRKKALRLYTEVLDRAPEETQGKVMVQVGHLYQLTGEETKALEFYQKILTQGHLPELKAEAQLSLGEIYFKRRDFAKARGYYQDVVKTPTANSRGLAAYRAAWCSFNLGEMPSALEQMEEILKTPSLLSRNGGRTGEVQADPQFHEEVSRDYVTFLSKKTIENKDVETLWNLSPESLRVQNGQSLALEAERLGKTAEALRVWNFVFSYLSRPEDRLAAKMSMAQLQFNANDKKTAMESFESAMQLWKELKACASTSCEEQRRRSRQFVVSWNQLEKKTPSAELLNAYRLYLANFPEDGDMNLYAATLAKELKNWDSAWSYYNKVRELALPAAKTDPAAATKLENALVALLDMAEESKNETYQTAAYNLYLEQSVNKTKSFEVRYQKAHDLYEKNQYAPAAQALRDLALDPQGNEKIRTQAANLSLDALVLLQAEDKISLWAADYAQALPGARKDFTEIVQKAVLTHSAQLAEKDAAAAYAELGKFQPAEAAPEDCVKYYKNKLILAEKLRKFSEAQGAADLLLQQTGLSAEEREFAWARKAAMAEMVLDFTTALSATEKLQKSLKPDEKVLKLAVFAELSGQKSAPYYAQYLQTAKDEERKKLVAAELVRKSPVPEKELDAHRGLLAKDPALMAQLYAEIYAKNPKEALLAKVAKDPALKGTDAGKLLSRVAFLKEFALLKGKLSTHQLETKNDRRLAASIKARGTFLENLEGLTKKAIAAGDWTSQLVSLDLLAKESERFYTDLLSAPLPNGLSDQEQQQYMQLLSAQATPFQAKATAAKSKVEEFWKNPHWTSALKASWEQGDLRSVMLPEIQALREIAPAESQKFLADLVVVKGESPLAAQRPSLQELQKARTLVNQNPFDKGALRSLLELEKKSQNTAMTQYLQTRLENLEKAPEASSEKGVL